MKALNVKDLTVHQKIGQLLMARSINSQGDFDFAMELIQDHALGGVQIFPGKEENLAQIEAIKKAADYPIFIAADMERGYQLGGLLIPGNAALGAVNSEKAAYEFARITATQAKNVGFNMIWSPVVDACPVNNENCPTRSLGADKKSITRLATAYLKAFADCGVIGAAKHFPSTTDNMIDTHMREGVSHHTEQDLLDNCIYPYLEMCKTLGDDMMGIMVSHTVCGSIDPEFPASLSKKVMDLIKTRGFNGLMISDSFAMMGTMQRFGDEKVLGLAVAAGEDLVLPNYRISLKRSYNYLMKCYEDGMFTEERLNDAVSKVLAAQARTMKMPENPEITDKDRETIESISRDCICAITEDGVAPALDKTKKHLFVVVTENTYQSQNSNELEISFSSWWNPKMVADTLCKEFPGSSAVFVSEFPSSHENERACLEATRHDDVVFMTFCECRCYQGTDAITERLCVLMRSMADKIAAIAHIGNPFSLENAPHVPRVVCGFPSKECVTSVIDVLTGKMPAKGTMPFPISLRKDNSNIN